MDFASPSPPDAQSRFLAHMLALMGLRGTPVEERLRIAVRPDAFAEADRQYVERGGVLLAIRPAAAFRSALGVSLRREEVPPCDLPRPGSGRGTLRTLHPGDRYAGAGEDLLSDAQGESVWRWVDCGAGGVLVAGTDLAADLLRFRQGDPAAAVRRPQEALWGIAGERPLYLFEHQLEGLPRTEQRQADFWAMLAARCIAAKAGMELAPILPGGAAGAVVITGDDDQAFLEKYAEQLRLLQGQPITYFLHPLTKHTPASMRRMFGRSRVELGLHPDALEAPHEYASLLAQQCAWFRELTGSDATSLRNHGFLNDGYWGHLHAWLDQGIRISANLPGLDGRPLNGSLLPARVCMDGVLTDHWSVVTAIGDGVRYVDGGRSDQAAAQCVFDCADQIRASGIPGLLVLNLHPQNVADTRAMHLAAVDVIRSGFLPWTMQDCVDWFGEGRHAPVPKRGILRGALDRALGSWRGSGVRHGVADFMKAWR